MPLKNWEILLPDGFVVRVRKETALGNWISFSVVLIYQDQCVTRYDTAHGTAHRDVIGKNGGLLEKKWYGNMSKQEAFEHALDEIKARYREFFDFFSAH